MMNCKECSEFLAAYLEGELDVATHEVFERHLADCPPCVDFLDGYRETIRLCRGAYSEADADRPPPEDLVRAILAAKGRGGGQAL